MDPTLGIPIPNIRGKKRILAVQPHYDDNDISAGGTLAALVESGAELHYLTMSDDLVGVIDENWSAEESARRLRADQKQAAEIVGVVGSELLGYPDAGKYDYFDLRRDMIQAIRRVRPHILFTMDPWMAYEAHTDHLLASRAAAEAAILYGLMRLKTTTQIDSNYQYQSLEAVVFHATSYPNTIFNITATLEKKNAAIRCYHAQFLDEELERLVGRTTRYARHIASEQPFEYGEALKIVPPSLLHGVGETIRF